MESDHDQCIAMYPGKIFLKWYLYTIHNHNPVRLMSAFTPMLKSASVWPSRLDEDSEDEEVNEENEKKGKKKATEHDDVATKVNAPFNVADTVTVKHSVKF